MGAYLGGNLDDRLGTAASAARTVVRRDRRGPLRRNWFGVAEAEPLVARPAVMSVRPSWRRLHRTDARPDHCGPY